MLKWNAEIGAVAVPATSEVIATAITGRAKRQRRSVWVRCHQARVRSPSNAATSAMVAAKDIWKPACIRLSGATTSTISAASATERRVIAGRSSSTATRTVAVMMKARWVGTSAPETKR